MADNKSTLQAWIHIGKKCVNTHTNYVEFKIVCNCEDEDIIDSIIKNFGSDIKMMEYRIEKGKDVSIDLGNLAFREK